MMSITKSILRSDKMINGKKCIGILTSGGDAPGMNATIRAIVQVALSKDIIPLGVIKGYNGLLEKNYIEMSSKKVSGIIQKGGTILFTERCKEFYEKKYQEIAYKNAVAAGIDSLVVIGGDGSFDGARALSELGLPCIGIPATIDNDIACTEYTIGYDTAMNTIVELVDKLSDTSHSHHRCSVVEVMGRHAGHIALNTGVACAAIQVITEEVPVDIKDVVQRINDSKKRGKDYFLIIVSEGNGQVKQIAKQIETLTGIDSRATILGHVQRGGHPSLRDRVIASKMGHYAVELLVENKGKRVVAMKNGKIVDYDICEALKMEKGLDQDLYNIFMTMGGC